MRRVKFRGSAPVRDEIIEPVEIVVSGSFPDRDIKRLEDVGRGFQEDAEKLFLALVTTLPQGTFIRLLGLMLNKEARNCCLIVPPAPESDQIAHSALERIANWDFKLDGDCIAEARAAAQTAIAAMKGESR